MNGPARKFDLPTSDPTGPTGGSYCVLRGGEKTDSRTAYEVGQQEVAGIYCSPALPLCPEKWHFVAG